MKWNENMRNLIWNIVLQVQIIQKTAEMIEVAKEKQPHKKYQISIWKCPCLEMEAVSQCLGRNDTGCPK